MNSFEIGRFGEKYAVKLLKRKKLKIVTTNYRCAVGEIDIIAKNKKEIVFVEVKARKSASHGTPAEYVDRDKIRHICKAANYFIGRYKVTLIPRFDIIELYIKEDEKKRISNLKQQSSK